MNKILCWLGGVTMSAGVGFADAPVQTGVADAPVQIGVADAPVKAGVTDAPVQLGVVADRPEQGVAVPIDGGRFMVPYTETIPGTDLTIKFVPIPGGTFLMGSPEDEAGRQADEGPQLNVTVDPMWVATTEVTLGTIQTVHGFV